MNIQSLSLRPIYQVLHDCYSGVTSPPPLPPRKGSEEYKAYRETYKAMLSDVRARDGVYIWVCAQPGEKIEYVYVGISNKNAKGLAGRLDDEFRQWYHVFWMTKFNSDRYIEDARRMYNTATVDYTSDILMQSRKAGGTHILYAGDIGGSYSLPDLETDLIYLFNCPRGNAPPTRSAKMHPMAESIRSAFEKRAMELDKYSPR